MFVTKTQELTQSELSTKLDSPNNILRLASERCQDIISVVLCNMYLSPCGGENAKTTPVPLCPEECNYVAQTCPDTWSLVMSNLKETGLPAMDCGNPAVILPPIDTCCSGFGIDVQYVQQSPSKWMLEWKPCVAGCCLIPEVLPMQEILGTCSTVTYSVNINGFKPNFVGGGGGRGGVVRSYKCTWTRIITSTNVQARSLKKHVL